jgi:tetratricopeptide (TPR) repeat protein
MQQHRSSSSLVLAILWALLGAAAHSFSVPPEYEEVPLDRLIKNLEAAVAANPRSLQAVLNLARTHAMAYSLKRDVATVFKDYTEGGWRRSGPGSGSEHVPFDRPVATSDPVLQARTQRHLEAALRSYERAARMAPDDLIVALGHAWLIERSGNEPRAIQMYRDLIAREWAKDPASQRPSPERMRESNIVYIELISVFPEDSIIPEAARYLIALLDPLRDRLEIATLIARLNIIEVRTRSVSPIAVPLRAGLQATDLEDRSARVAFDADGSGQQKHWTWITTDAAWLVYQRPARIDSALQLFGNFTFWLFWSNGYEALAALDDDRDGTLMTGELAELALWQDADGDGRSDDGEVQSLAAHGIVAVSYEYRHDLQHPDRIAYAPAGVVFADGSSRPTYDLMLHPR